MSLATLGWLLSATAVFVTANTVLRTYVGNGIWYWLAGALVLYTAGNIMMVSIMRAAGLGLAIAVTSILQLLAVALVAFAVFGERPTPMQLAGMALGIVAVALMIWPRGASG
jgi:glucose uptake protein